LSTLLRVGYNTLHAKELGSPVVTIFRLAGASPELFASAASMAAASALLPHGAYTSLRTYGGGGRVLRLADHLARLREGAPRHGAQLDEPKVRAGLAQALKAAGKGESRLRLTYAWPQLFVAIEPLDPLPEALYRDGVSCLTVPLQRAAPRVKDTHFISMAQAAYRDLPAGVHEALMLGEDGAILEGLSSNFFAVREGILHTEGDRALPGITRGLVLELAKGLLPLATGPVRLDQLPELTEAFLTSVSRGVLPVVKVDATTVGDGRPGTVTRELRRRFDALVERESEPLSA
jgi:branched-chain amino acid aminotransferase